jgi:excisionase family DNA binding protein
MANIDKSISSIRNTARSPYLFSKKTSEMLRFVSKEACQFNKDLKQTKINIMKNNHQSPKHLKNHIESSKPVLSFAEAAHFLGISHSYLYKLTSQRKIAHSKPNGKKIYFKREDLLNWMLSKPVETLDDIERRAANYITNNKIKDH